MTWRMAKRVAVVIAGGTILLIGIVLLVLPGPAIVVIPVGLALLATEFIWAQRLLRRARIVARRQMRRARRRKPAKPEPGPSAHEPDRR